MSSFCTAKATHIFSAKNFSIFAYHRVNFKEFLTNDIVSFEQLGPDLHRAEYTDVSCTVQYHLLLEFLFLQAQEDLDQAKRIYDELNNELHTELPEFYNR